MAQDQLFPLEEIKASSNWRGTKLAFCFGHSLIVCGAFYVLHMPDVIAMIDAMYRVNRHQFNSSPASERHVDPDQAGLSGAQRKTRRGLWPARFLFLGRAPARGSNAECATNHAGFGRSCKIKLA